MWLYQIAVGLAKKGAGLDHILDQKCTYEQVNIAVCWGAHGVIETWLRAEVAHAEVAIKCEAQEEAT